MIPLIIALVIESFFLLVNQGYFIIQIVGRKSILFSILFIYIIYFILLGLTKKTSRSVTIISVISFIFLIVNQIKIIYMGEPIILEDFNFLFTIGNFVQTTKSSLKAKIWEYIVVFIDLGVVFFLITYWSIKHNKNFTKPINRIITVIVGVICIVILFFPNKNMQMFYLNAIFDNDKIMDHRNYTTNLGFYKEYSLIAGIWGISLQNKFVEPEGYSKEEINNVLKKVSDDNKQNEKDWGTPNIILVFSEAFWDVEKINEVQFNKKITEGLNEIKEKGNNVQLLSCSYGGMSENVSFELLTGGSMNYFNNSYIPIMSLYKRKNIIKAPSIIQNLKENGYYSKIVYGKDYYNCESAMKKIGFDEYIEYEETEENKKGYFVSDEFIIDEVIKYFENKEKGQKTFYMATTIENHLPFTIDKFETVDVEIEKSPFSEDINNTLITFAQGIYDASNQIDRLYKYVMQYDEPTIIIFLGDHLPYLYTEEGKNALNYVNYFNTTNNLENIYRSYNTDCYIISNYEINYDNMPKYLSNDMLLTYVINQMNLPVNTYYKWLYSTIDVLPAMNKYLAVDKAGKKYSINNIPKDMEEIYKIKEMMQYDNFINIK